MTEPSEIAQKMVLKAPIAEIRLIAENTVEVSFSLGGNFSFIPGQYVHISLPKINYYDVRGRGRDFTIVSPPGGKTLSIAFRNTQSGFKRTLLEEKNMLVEISGPFGFFTLPEKTETSLIFIAGGIGVTPFMSMLKHISLNKLPYRVKLIYINSYEAKAVYLEELKLLADQEEWFSLELVFGRLTQSTLHHGVENYPMSTYMIAGPPAMVNNTYGMLEELGIDDEQIRFEEFTGYDDNAELDTKTDRPLGRGTNEAKVQVEDELVDRPFSDLRALLHALNNTAIVSETNSAGTITSVNDKFVEISKYTREELIGQNHRILKSGTHSKAFYENLWSTITRGKLWRGVIKNKAKDGSYYWVDTCIAPILDRKGKPIKYISVRFPVTERQQAEDELRERAKQQSVLTLLSQEALANTELKELFRKTVAMLTETLGVEYSAIFKLLPGDKQVYYETGIGFNIYRENDRIVNVESDSIINHTLMSSDPVIVTELATEASFTGFSMLYDANVVSGISLVIPSQERPFGILQVYSSSKRVFKKEDIYFVQAIANLLANAVRNQLDKRKDEFLGIASHELKTPLTTIKTFIQLLQKQSEQQEDNQYRSFTSKISSQVDRLTDLINDLLDISRINTGKLNYNDEYFDLSVLVQEVVNELSLVTNNHTIKIESEKDVSVFADKYRISQILVNLISNATKYSPNSNQIEIKIVKEKDTVLVSVQDFGVGIPVHEQQHIFERFYQGSPEKRKSFPGGLGLGLHICAEIIKRHQGNIWVESQEGSGSTFYFSLPYKL